MLSHFYAVNGKYLARLADFFEKALTRPAGDPEGGPMSTDGALSFFLAHNRDVLSYVATPNLATQRSSKSDLSPNWFDEIPLLKTCVGIARRARNHLIRRLG